MKFHNYVATGLVVCGAMLGAHGAYAGPSTTTLAVSQAVGSEVTRAAASQVSRQVSSQASAATQTATTR